MPVKTMAMPCSSAAAITSSSRIDPPGWITAVAPAATADSKPSAKGKNASEATTEPLVKRRRVSCRFGSILGLARCNAGAVDAAHLPGADANSRAILDVDDGIGFHVLGDAEGKLEIGHFRFGRRALGDDLEFQIVDDAAVARLDEDSPGDSLGADAGGARVRQAAGDQQAQVLLCRDDRLALPVSHRVR